jgi:cytidine deaminase
MVDNEQMSVLFLEAKKAAQLAYAPYSGFRVGAALLCEDGTIITGVNVENRSYGLTICAERTAITKAVSMGKQKFTALAIHTPDSIEPVGPCGACRQVVSEFMSADAPVRFAGSGTVIVNTTLGVLLPMDSLYDLKPENNRIS